MRENALVLCQLGWGGYLDRSRCYCLSPISLLESGIMWRDISLSNLCRPHFSGHAEAAKGEIEDGPIDWHGSFWSWISRLYDLVFLAAKHITEHLSETCPRK